MNKTKIVFGIGIVLVLAVFTASAADNVIRIEPSDIICGEEEVTNVWVYLNATDAVTGFQFHLQYEDDVVDIVNMTSAVEGTNPDWLMWDPYWKVDTVDGHHYLLVTGTLLMSSVTGDNIELAKISLKCLSPGERPLEFWKEHHTHPTKIVDENGNPLPLTLVNGTFTCLAPQETFSKDLVEGWNLISLPLYNATDMRVANIMSSVSGLYDALYRYDASTHSWVPLSSSDTMANGVGYFVHMTSAGTWTYQGSAYLSMSIPLEQGLNMIGWLNCSKPIGDALSSIDGDYWYVARWNATAQKFEVYNPVAPNGFNDFDTMERGEGYFISMKNAGTLTASC